MKNISSKKLNVNKISMDFSAAIWYNIFVRLRELRKQKEKFIKCLLDKSMKICYNNNRDKERRLLDMMTPDEIIRILSDTSFEERLKKEMAEIKRMKKEFVELRKEIQEQLDKLEK